MTKRNKITFLIAEALLAVLAAYFFYSIFQETRDGTACLTE